MGQFATYSRRGAVGIITVDNPPVNALSIGVRRGIVEVRPSGQPTAAPIARLTKGQGLSHREGQPGDRVAPTDPEAAFAWTDGRLVFRGERLADVAAQPLVTCDVDNVGSAAVIEANGGVLEDVRGTKRRYWVPTGG